MAVTPVCRLVRFGVFEADFHAWELRKNGLKINLQQQPFQILALLLIRPGELVTREELRQELWPANTFVDFDDSLNTAVQKLRRALHDSAESPKFVETVPRNGYRFISPVESLSTVSSVGKEESVQATAGVPPVRWWAAVWVALSLAAVVLVAFNLHGGRSRVVKELNSVPIRSIAVLPLMNVSGDPAQEYFADGMTDELITTLAKNRSLRIISHTSVMQYKRVRRPLRDIARDLGVDGILEGSVARSANHLHLTAQLIRAASDTHVWAESYDRDLSDVYALQDELAQTIATQVGVTASASSKPEKRINPQAHDAYLLGRYYWFSSDSEKSKEYFRKAIDLQPDYAAAWSGLADYFLQKGVAGEARPETVMPQGQAAAKKALELDDSLPEAHNSMAAAFLFYRWDWKRAEQESARAVELNPGFAEAHHLRGYVLEALNRTDEALREQRKSMELDPFARPWALGLALIRAHQFDAALNEARLRSEAQPNDAGVHALLTEAYHYKGREKESAQEWERTLLLGGEKNSASAVRQAFARGGYQAVLDWRLSDLKKKAAKEYVSALDFAETYASLKRKDEAIHYLERAYEEHAPFMVHIQNNPNFDLLHSDPRYRAIVRNMGLPAAQ